MATCTCDYSLQNTGTPSCEPLQKYTTGVIFVPYYDSTGTLNSIPAATTVNASYVTGKLNQTDTSKRWFPLMNVKNAASEKGDNIVETFEDQSAFLISEGVRKDTFILAAKSPILVGKLNSFQCDEMGVFYVDKAGNLIGMVQSDGSLAPIKIQKGTLANIYTTPTTTTVPKITVSYQFEIDELDENLRMFTNSVSWSTINGLLDVNVAVSNESTTGATLTLTYDYGYANSKNKVIGLVVSDFVSSDSGATSKIYNVTDDADVTISSVTESADGVYDLTWTAQTSADVLQPAASKNGFDFSNLLDETVVIP